MAPRRLFGIFMTMFMVQGCAHSRVENVRLNRELAAENDVSTGADLRAESKKIIENAPDISDAQRSQLMDLRRTTRAKLKDQSEESLKLRGLLVKDMLADKYDEDEVEAIKSKMKKLEDDRLTAIFDAVKRANLILGHNVAKNEGVIHDFLTEMPGDAHESVHGASHETH